MTVFYAPSEGRWYRAAQGQAAVGSSGSTLLATITVPDGWAIRLVEAHADFLGSSLLSTGRGVLLRAKESSDVQLARSAVGGSDLSPSVRGVVYENTTGGDVDVELRAFHGGTGDQDMVGHHTWVKLSD